MIIKKDFAPKALGIERFCTGPENILRYTCPSATGLQAGIPMYEILSIPRPGLPFSNEKPAEKSAGFALTHNGVHRWGSVSPLSGPDKVQRSGQ